MTRIRQIFTDFFLFPFKMTKKTSEYLSNPCHLWSKLSNYYFAMISKTCSKRLPLASTNVKRCLPIAGCKAI
jgi:hypothetical protein